MINGTTANCKVKSVTVTDSTAAISCILYSLSPATEHKAFKFYLKDKNSNTLIPISENIYWIDRINNYNNDILNIDVNQYIEALFFVDITNSNSGTVIGNKWVRECNLVLRNIKEPLTSYAWISEDLTLISKEFEIPTIKDLDIYSDKQFNLYINYFYHYTSQADFNYNNKNLYATINIISPFTNNVLETIETTQDDVDNRRVCAQSLNIYTTLIKIQIQLKNSKGVILSTIERLYQPIARTTSTYIKTSKGIERALAFYIKDSTSSSSPMLRLRSTSRQTLKEVINLKMNLNNIAIKLPTVEEPKLSCVGENTIHIINSSAFVFPVNRMVIYLDDVLIGETTGKTFTYTLSEEELEASHELRLEVEGTNHHYKDLKTFFKTFKFQIVCSENTLCSEETICTDV